MNNYKYYIIKNNPFYSFNKNKLYSVNNNINLNNEIPNEKISDFSGLNSNSFIYPLLINFISGDI